MISLFQISPQDQSVYYLGQIFGVVSDGVLAPQKASMLLGVLFKVFNTSVLTLGAGIVIYTTIVGLMKTAQEGEFLGKQWSSLWVPLRTVFGIAALFPLPTGYSSIQVIFMWIIMQGVGAADTIWNTVINYTIVAGSPLGQQDVTEINSVGLDTKFNNLFQALVCQAQAARTTSDFKINGIRNVRYYCSSAGNNAKTPFCATTTTNAAGSTIAQVSTALPTNTSSNVFSIGPKGYCGHLTYCQESSTDYCGANSTSQQCIVCQSQKKALNLIIPVLASIAEKTAQTDDEYLQATLNAETPIKNYQAPAWISDYCADKADPTTCITSGYNIFDGTNSSDPGNASQDLMQRVYWKWSIKPFIIGSQTTKVKDFIASSQDLYLATLASGNIAGVGTEIANNNGARAAEWQKKAISYGWIFAGGYFYKVVQEGAKTLKTYTPDLVMSAPPTDDMALNSNMKYRSNYTAADYLLSKMKQEAAADAASPSSSSASSVTETEQATGSTSGVPSQFSAITSSISSSAASILNAFVKMMAECAFVSNTWEAGGSLVVGAGKSAGNVVAGAGKSAWNVTKGAGKSFGALFHGDTSGTAAKNAWAEESADSGSAKSAWAEEGADTGSAKSAWNKSFGATGTYTNPLVPIGNFGRMLMSIAKLLFVAVAGISFLLVGLFTINPIVVGTGLTMNPIGEAFKTLLSFVSPFFVALMLGMYSLGAILGIYLPLIPFMIFTMGALGWLLTTVEAMVAAPIVALGILSPGGQSELLGRAEPAVMLMLNLFLRPGLMVIGLMAAVLVSVPVMALVNTAFLGAVSTIITNPDIFEELLIIAFYSSFVVTVIAKCYALTYIVPERVLTWIGGQAVQYGEAEAMQSAKQAIEGGAHAAGGALKEMESGAGDKALRLREAQRKYKEAHKPKPDANVAANQNNNNNNNQQQ